MEGVHYYRKNMIFVKNVAKNYQSDIESILYERERFKMFRKLAFHGTMYLDRGEKYV